MKLNHLNLSVTDVSAAQAFLEKHFGMRHGGGNRNIALVTDENGCC
ncbi:MAG TPA: VOC family protein [Luteitalea sp.]|nr:VOC family protein [Luteitalea sp.]